MRQFGIVSHLLNENLSQLETAARLLSPGKSMIFLGK
jgi:hypothetical protein